jgi:hypothetical protein
MIGKVFDRSINASVKLRDKQEIRKSTRMLGEKELFYSAGGNAN